VSMAYRLTPVDNLRLKSGLPVRQHSREIEIGLKSNWNCRKACAFMAAP
jgi:hypothetical protein